MLTEISTTVGSVTVRAGGGDAHAIRQSVSGQLGCADLTPASLAPSAFLIVRQLRDPMPGRIGNSQDQPGINDEWERAAVEKLSLVHERAARPSKGVIPADCEAVLFADEAEMMACLSIDFAYGCVMHRWWWELVSRYLPGGPSSALSVGSLLHNNRHLVPAALEYVSEWGLVESVLSELSAEEALGVLSAILDHFGLPELNRDIGEIVRGTSHSDHSSTAQPRSPGGSESIRSEGPSGLAASGADANGATWPRQPKVPWAQIVGPATSPPSLTWAQSLLFGVALTLQRAPAVLRRAEFQSGVARWLRAEMEGHERYGNESVDLHAAWVDSVADDTDRIFIDDDRTPPAGDGLSPAASDIRLAADLDQSLDRVDPDSEPSAQFASSQAESVDDSLTDDEETLNAAESDLLFAGIDPVRTAFGGVFFLINLITFLGLPESCARWRLGQHVGQWGLLEFLARKLLGAGPASHDPLWAVLAEFTKTDSPGLTGASQGELTNSRLPIEWSGHGAVAGESYGWSASRDRLRLWTSEGYLIADVARCGQHPSRQALDELRLHRPDCNAGNLRRQAIRAAQATIGAAIDASQLDDDLQRWFAFVQPFLLTLLRQQMDMAKAGPDAIVDELLKRPGDLFVTKTHIDLVFDIESTSMAVRRAGLDCDPGWLPEFGRVIKFHYQ